MAVDKTFFGFAELRRNPGFSLVGTGCIVLYITLLRGTSMHPYVQAASLSLAGIFGLAGIWLMSRDMSRQSASNNADEDFGPNIEHTARQLTKNYNILRQQASQGFSIAAVVMMLGVLVIIAGAAGQVFGFAKAGSLTTVAGVVTELISGMGLYLFNKTFDRLNVTSDRLQDTWRILEAFNRAERLDNDQRSKVIPLLIQQLARPQSSVARAPGKPIRKNKGAA